MSLTRLTTFPGLLFTISHISWWCSTSVLSLVGQQLLVVEADRTELLGSRRKVWMVEKGTPWMFRRWEGMANELVRYMVGV